MAKRAYPRRYAQAAFELALRDGALEKWQADLSRVVSLSKDAQLMALLESPRLTFAEKSGLLAEGLGGISPLVLNLVYLLVARGRLGLIGEIAEEYQRLWDRHRGIEHAEVITAIPMEEADRQKLAKRLSEIVGRQVVLTPRVDPKIIGGIIAHINGRLLDGSTRRRLESLHKALVASPSVRTN